MRLIDDSGTRQQSCHEISPAQIRALTSGLATRIVELLAQNPQGMHPAGIAKRLREHEQKVYYHCRRMIKERILQVDRVEDAHGGTAKILTLRAGAFAVRFSEFLPATHTLTISPLRAAFLTPLVVDGILRSTIVVGSPDPHGPEGARSRDVNYAVDIALFLGSMLTTPAPPSVILDTELRDWNRNLIIVGGVVVNKAAERVNAKSPVPYDAVKRVFRVANGRADGKAGEKELGGENVGVIVKMRNPYARGKWILHIAGKRSAGTRAAMLALLTRFDDVCAAGKPNGECAIIVEGMDADSDGIVDTAHILRTVG